MTDVELISRLCELDNEIRDAKTIMNRCAAMIRMSNIKELPPHLAKQVPGLIADAKRMLSLKRAFRLELWKKYGIFYWSDV